MTKLEILRLSAPRCASMAAGAGSLEKSNFLVFSKVLRKAPDQANYIQFFAYQTLKVKVCCLINWIILSISGVYVCVCRFSLLCPAFSVLNNMATNHLQMIF